MISVQDLQHQIDTIEAEIKELESLGIPDRHYTLDSSTNSSGVVYYRLRWTQDGKRQSQVLQPKDVENWKIKIERYRTHHRNSTQLKRLKTQLARKIKHLKDLGVDMLNMAVVERPAMDDRDLFDRALRIYWRRSKPEQEQGVVFDQPGYNSSYLEGSTYYLRNSLTTLARFRVSAAGHLSFAGWGPGRI